MINGQLLVAGDNAVAVSSLTQWMSRQADNVWLTWETWGVVGSPTLDVEMLQKNSDSPSRDGGTGTTLSPTSTTVGNTTFYTVRVSALKEMLRFRVSITYTGGAGVSPEMMFLRFHEPTWYDTAAA